MRTFNKTQEDRKILVNRIGDLTGKKLTYTRVPHCAYEGFGFTVTKEGKATGEYHKEASWLVDIKRA